MSQRPLTSRLKSATQELHGVAERAGSMSELLRGRVERSSYCLMLRNLHALYEALEAALDRHEHLPLVGPVRLPVLYRAGALADDLRQLHGTGWNELRLTEAMHSYVARLDHLSRTRPPLLAAHAYVRYMGDLSGGQILREVVRRGLRLADGAGTAFYTFAGDVDAEVIKHAFRAALDALPVDDDLAQDIVAEARDSFALHIRLFEELDRASATPG